MIRYLAAALTLLALTASIFAAKVKVWHHHTFADHDKAQLRQAVVSSEGTIRLARQLQPLVKLKANHVWDVVEDKAGNLIVASGGEGKIYKVTPEGKVTVLYTSSDSQVLCLVRGEDGSVYAGTGPNGLIICLPTRGKPKVVAEHLDGYVWSLVRDEISGMLYAGTGPKGRIWQVPPEGQPAVFYTTRQDHVLCLTRNKDGMLYAGTARGGLIYRIDPRGKGFIVYSAPQSEVRSLVLTPQGLLAGTSAPTKRGESSGSSSNGVASGQAVPLQGGNVIPASSKKVISTEPHSTSNSPARSSNDDDKDSNKGTPAAAPSLPGMGENSVYRIATDGTVRELFREKALVLRILRRPGRLLLGTGMQGQLFEIDEQTKERWEIARLEQGQIHCLLQRRDGSVVVGTGDPGQLYVLHDGHASKGTVISDILDAKLISKWGALDVQADVPAGCGVSVAVRSGNVALPDDTWSDWSEEIIEGTGGKIAAPPARYLQYRVTLTSDNPKRTPTLRSVALRYLTTNQAPEVTKIEVPDLESGTLDNPRKLKLRWTAVDPNEDELTYSIYIRKDGWKNWVCLEEDLGRRDYEWDPGTLPSGMYQVRIVASDRRDNTSEEALTGERISRPFVVTTLPPVVQVKVVDTEGGRAIIEASATDPLVRLTEASFSLNGKKWVNIFPRDGLFDSKSESFRFQTDHLPPGTHVLVLRVRDAAGNIGSGDVVFTVPDKK